MDNIPDFYLASTEDHHLSSPRRCWRVQRMSDATRDDWLLIRVDPPLHGWEHPAAGVGDRDFRLAFVGARHVGVNLFPIATWPVDVYVAVPLVRHPERLRVLSAEQFRLVSWAELYPTEEAARAKGRPGALPRG